MIPDAEIVSLICTVCTRLDIGDFTVKINHRKILDGIFEVCGVPPEKIRTISSAVDKLDKVRYADHGSFDIALRQKFVDVMGRRQERDD